MMTKEYIERKTAIKMIEEDLPEVVHYRKEDAIECLEYMPTVDAVVIVRCRDCQHYIDGCCYVSNRTNKGTYPRVNIHSRNENDYCSYGERKTDDD